MIRRVEMFRNVDVGAMFVCFFEVYLVPNVAHVLAKTIIDLTAGLVSPLTNCR